MLALACSASAAWSDYETLSVPGWDGSKIGSKYALKESDDTQCTFYASENQAWGLYGVDGRLVQDQEPYSSWARDMHSGVTCRAACTAVKGEEYQAQLSTDKLEPNTIKVKFKFSPDYEL